MAAVCTFVKILKIRRMVNKMGDHVKLKWVYLPFSKMEGGLGEGGTESFYFAISQIVITVIHLIENMPFLGLIF